MSIEIIDENHRFVYDAFVTGVYDGDSITVKMSMGLNLYKEKEKIRLFRIDTPEIRGDSREAGLVSRDWLRERILNQWILIKTVKPLRGKYGRLLAEVIHNNENINDLLVTEGLAIYRNY